MGVRTGARTGLAIVAGLFAVLLIIQVFLAGLGVFDSPTAFATHRDFGYTIGLLILPLIILALVGRAPKGLVALTILIAVQMTLQSVFVAMRESNPAVGDPGRAGPGRGAGIERRLERRRHVTMIRARAWWLLVAIAVVIALFGLTDMASGLASDPAITTVITGLGVDELLAQDPAGHRLADFVTRSLGLNLLLLGTLFTIILVVPYRAGRRWAWRAMWLLPAWAVLVPGVYLAFGTAPGAPPSPPMISGPIIGLIAVGVLLLDRRRVSDPGA
jgi:hypothetical protein